MFRLLVIKELEGAFFKFMIASMVQCLALNMENRMLCPERGNINTIKIGICCFVAKLKIVNE